MDGIHWPCHPHPNLPIGPSETNRTGSQRFKGKIVGGRLGRSNEIRTMQILTIKLDASSPDAGCLLHGEVGILMSSK
jgi:hypothetical protein